MPTTNPLMLQETREAPQVVERLLRENAPLVQDLIREVRSRDPLHVVTVARGSSDHACTVLKYAIEASLGLSVGSAAPSVHTLYGRSLRLERALVLAVSQSGASPDVVESVTRARACGALTVAFVNQEDSDLARAAEFVLPLRAGTEQAVAATKSYLASLAAGLQLVAALADDRTLSGALEVLPDTLAATLLLEDVASERAERYRYAETMVVLGRGAHFGVALESALKLKETSGLMAEAYSAAEFLHGPVRVVEAGFPILALQARDETAASTADAYRALSEKAVELLLVGAEAPLPAPLRLITPASGHGWTDTLPSALSVYLLAGHLALARGLDPDAPPSLRKVTLTR
ncbi:SIS domain-containing protein [Deinococcus peraridilitoris]|uniref:Putative phosphosugar isomerase n=1 Tax=Deinococcus peraridilitoris (strain DSM 19664 / LMG 22246 / CIP 109416 / KR-200) TaxID=937777 RepID=L0A4P6_DEIPD|nr:SIS domain-containing protein [Deinococcus peraridilitoris]AFZ68127.1 putative phosphosugar isomerase [Deinococcus peraridilitoris DSM 19664]